MWLGKSGCIRARWTRRINEEWIQSAVRKRPELERARLLRTAEFMERAIMDALVEDYEDLIPGLHLPDVDDRHVLAAAIRGGAEVIVTFNEQDFPAEYLAKFGVKTQHPDDFALCLFKRHPVSVLDAAGRQRRQLKNPPIEVDRYLEIMSRQGLTQTSKALMEYRAIL
ncbi:hypothetical protein AGMMS49545_09040 [Betaproteobacteria bacterium]|nr:hypothetical protein AGMMS49545_09040 [Betaproteobacteria bacterium]GHU43986.1 hypothetical protein AGMMS50289_11380 [Betaproteobacteria bacterium]